MENKKKMKNAFSTVQIMIIFKYAYIRIIKMAYINRGHFSKSNKYLQKVTVTVRDIYDVTLISVDNHTSKTHKHVLANISP